VQRAQVHCHAGVRDRRRLRQPGLVGHPSSQPTARHRHAFILSDFLPPLQISSGANFMCLFQPISLGQFLKIELWINSSKTRIKSSSCT
jgi:hypothetical protein